MIRIILAYLVIGMLITIHVFWDDFDRIEAGDDPILAVVTIIIVGSLMTPIWTMQNFIRGTIEIFKRY